MAVPKAPEPAGIILADKPPGPTSFAVVARVRARTRAKTGHAGTLDPFASGLLLLLSGRATKLASCFVGLDKRYATDIDLTSRTSTGDLEGDVIERRDPPGSDRLEQDLAAFRGDVDLRVPSASAVKIEGERAYRLHRRGVAVEMPIRRSHIASLELVSYRVGVASLDLRVGSGTYVRAIADALGGHCVALRRIEIGPFAVDEADERRVIPIPDALARIGLSPDEADGRRSTASAT
jgi:tRNA pseudouridine55 synthase